MKIRSHSILFILTLILSFASACAKTTDIDAAGSGSGKTPLIIFGAGSLIIPFGDLEKAFESRYPNIDIQAQYHGSIQVIRHATELHEPIDVVATADASLIPMLMYNVNDPQTNLPYANWYIRFATNHLALAYQPKSLYVNEINAENWYTILTRPDVKVGFADPRFDAAGYRALMTFALARDFYHAPTAFMDMFGGQFNYPFGIFSEDNQTTITVPQIVEIASGSHIMVRGASIQLIALLESGDLDYAFEYESVIKQHGLQMVQLPEAINLGAENMDYSNVVVEMDYQRFASVKPEFRGERIGYGITIPSNAPHPEEAALFIAFLLEPKGRSIMEADYHPVFDPAIASQYDNLPDILKSLCQPQTP
jgi:molybdate/tungstate transport system substrate-binding protein